ncbi:GLPGLI family protein [Chitinophaga pendula]|uniref:GLPGLI family protein n=1 Tax=Chitinophaga TaxID=79328 RepID=UPI000BAFF0C8|nr:MULTISPECIES: GLPGLI family protein [Chitinophaga]ASZ12675.1 hypothetical protein CK934_17780 [Chitinophaga sp. MD30]UCJ09715.1 GLPGLI family protein [Chitinophaga pendula]
MKRILLTVCSMIGFLAGHAQQQEGTVVYELNMQFPKGGMALGRAVAATRMDATTSGKLEKIDMPKVKFEASFTKEHMLWQHLDEELPTDPNAGMDAHFTAVGGSEETTYTNFTTGNITRQQYVFDKAFLIRTKVTPLPWKIAEETKTILGKTCRKAVASRPEKKMQMSMRDGKFEPVEITDTAKIIAWFTTDIPVPVAPQIAGQLPGLVLELQVGNDVKTTFTAVSLTDKVKAAGIRPPTKGKEVSEEVFAQEKDKMFRKMRAQMPAHTISVPME